jgi:photosystem II stability/assembly factor-like uncharacterized protein
MDSPDRNETKIRRREETLARRVGEALDQMNPHLAGECPGAEVIAAYAEQALGPAESTQWEGHFARCARCRKILHVLAASADTPLAEKEVAQLGELVSAVRAPVEIVGRAAGGARPRRVNWRTRWLAPAFGVAAVLAVWFTIRPPWRATDRGASETLVAQAPKEEVPSSPVPAEVDRLSRVAPQQDQKKESAPLPDRSSATTPPLNSAVDAPAKGRADADNEIGAISPSARDAAGSLQEKKKLGGLPDGREIQPSAIPPAPPAPPKAPAAVEAPAAPRSETKAELDTSAAEASRVKTNSEAAGNATMQDKQAAKVQGEAGATIDGAVGQKTLPELRSNGRNDQTFEVIRPARNYSSLLKAPAGATLWRAGKGGTIERSTNAGKTWVSQMSPSPQDWLAGAAVSDTVCWLVGRNGSIARTTDGEHWQAVISPPVATSASGRFPDWVGVSATGPQAASITGGDQQRYATQDGGQTWQVR